jgi:hypothetical protein
VSTSLIFIFEFPYASGKFGWILTTYGVQQSAFQSICSFCIITLSEQIDKIDGTVDDVVGSRLDQTLSITMYQ